MTLEEYRQEFRTLLRKSIKAQDPRDKGGLSVHVRAVLDICSQMFFQIEIGHEKLLKRIEALEPTTSLVLTEDVPESGIEVPNTGTEVAE